MNVEGTIDRVKGNESANSFHITGRFNKPMKTQEESAEQAFSKIKCALGAASGRVSILKQPVDVSKLLW